MLTEKMNVIFPLCYSIFFQPFPTFSPNVHITTELNGTIIQEFFITMLLSNISSLIKKEADEKIADTADESNKYEYQANRNFIIGAIVINLPKILCNVFEVSKINSIYIEAIRCKSQIQPNRSFLRRKNKMRCQKHYGNKKTTR